MLSMHRLIIAVAVALCVLPAAAQARPGFVPPSSSTSASPAVHYGHPHTSIKLDQVSPDARYGVPDATPRPSSPSLAPRSSRPTPASIGATPSSAVAAR